MHTQTLAPISIFFKTTKQLQILRERESGVREMEIDGRRGDAGRSSDVGLPGQPRAAPPPFSGKWF
ncbi:hypothetical protein Hanom_Chr02g00130711 [Helianthus anomalus]